ncbi:hypothetical protein EAI_05756 [Harpegnathos saltator]|uniref:Uncharacterized protein n=1 Tax=Harpegnathos saltator TaxID=610380 RepID=E2BUM6_HARSA|nr:hypothetical protein EAI_05756 [Harpegnathos saltator]
MSKVCCIVNCESKCPNLGPNKRMLFEFPKVSTPLEGALPTQENEAIEYTIEALKRNFEAPEHSSETIE